MIGAAFKPVRNRLVLAVVVLVSGALLGAGWALYLVEAQRLDRQTTADLERQVQTFRDFEQHGADPVTGKPFASPESMVEAFLQRNVPLADTEVLWDFTEPDSPQYVGSPAPSLKDNRELARSVKGLADAGGTSTITAGGSVYEVVVVPVRMEGSPRQALFVVTHNVSATRAPLSDLMKVASLIGAAAIVVVAIVAAVLLAGMLRPLHRLLRAADTVGAGSLGERIPVTGYGDIAELQEAFNSMLARLESAFDAQRQMLDDAGHELRTPLTVLRGHLEVLNPDDPDDVRATRDLLISETTRMSRLVADLLVLAKSGRPDFISLQLADVGELTRGVVARSRTLAVRNWQLGQVADGVAHVDADRITQALLQLAENSARYTQTGGTIEMGSRFVGDRIEFWVKDDGPGVDPAIREKMFTRFATTRDDHEGFGLGLSIVRAIVEAHHGTIQLEDSARGASFRISIPRGVLA